MNSTIEIHEFSTGIQVDGNPGNWVSKGFAGRYMNSTRDYIPQSIEGAINSGYFDIAESTSSSQPAVIGRDITGGDGNWSVVAVVTSGRDDRGRTASLYRYFYCQEAGNIHHILQWMYSTRKGIIVFDPFDRETIGRPHQHLVSTKKPKFPEILENLLFKSNSLPIIVPSDYDCPPMPMMINQMASRLGNFVSWAFNVKGIAKPQTFQVIQPNDKRSETIIRNAIDRTPKLLPLQGQEHAITTAIKGLTNNKKFKSEHLSTIENNLEKIDKKNWEYFFEKLGAKDAVREKIYSSQMIRLVTLQAMVLPATLPKFLSWIWQAKNQEYYDVSTTFQSQIRPYLSSIPSFNNRLHEGVIPLIPNLVQKPQLVDAAVWLLGEREGAWSYLYKKQVMPEIDSDLTLINQAFCRKQSQVNLNILSDSAWKNIYNYLAPYWQPNANKDINQEFQPIAEFFGNLVTEDRRELQLHALFSHLSQGKISKKLYSRFNKDRKNPNKTKVNVYGIWLKREVTFIEEFLNDTREFIRWLWTSKIQIPLLLPVIAAAVLLIIFGFKNLQFSLSGISDIPIINKIWGSEANKDQFRSISIPGEDLKTAIDKFQDTRKVIKEDIYDLLFNDIKNNSDPKTIEKKIKKAIENTLDPQGELELKYDIAIEKELDKIDEKEIEKWIEAIYLYQKEEITDDLKELGYIKALGYLTYNISSINEELKKDVRENLK